MSESTSILQHSIYSIQEYSTWFKTVLVKNETKIKIKNKKTATVSHICSYLFPFETFRCTCFVALFRYIHLRSFPTVCLGWGIHQLLDCRRKAVPQTSSELPATCQTPPAWSPEKVVVIYGCFMCQLSRHSIWLSTRETNNQMKKNKKSGQRKGNLTSGCPKQISFLRLISSPFHFALNEHDPPSPYMTKDWQNGGIPMYRYLAKFSHV